MRFCIKLIMVGVMALLSINAAMADGPKQVTIGYLNLVNAQLVTKSLGLVQG